MKRTVTITIEVDATEYHEAEDTASGTIDLVIDMLRGDADLPAVSTIVCENIRRHTRDHLES